MKNLIYGVLFLAIVGTSLFSSCSKSENYIDTDSNFHSSKKSITSGTRHLLLDGENTNCKEPGISCLCGDDDIVITPDNSVFMDVFSEINKGDEQAIRQSFETNYDVLTRYVKPFFIKGVIDGNISVSAHENTTNSLKFFFFKDISSGEEMAYQLNFIK